MKRQTSPPRYSSESVACADAEPGRRRLSGRSLGWTSVLVETFEGGRTPDSFGKPATPDQTLSVVTRGRRDLEVFHGGRWRRASRPAGSAGLTPGGQSQRLRENRVGGRTFDTAHLYVPQEVFLAAADEYRRAGTSPRLEPLDAIGFNGPVVAQITRSLVTALRAGAPDLYAESAVQFLATHLLAAGNNWPFDAKDTRRPSPLTDRRLARVADYIEHFYMEPLSLDDLARKAGVSRFHFVALFRRRAGVTPYQFLVAVRLRAAASLLRETAMPVAAVAAA